MVAIKKTNGKAMRHGVLNRNVPLNLANPSGTVYLRGNNDTDGSFRNVENSGTFIMQKRMNGAWKDIQRSNEDQTVLTKSIKTGVGSLHLGDLHNMSSAGENVIFLNQNTNVAWFPVWQGITPDGTVITPAASRQYSALTTLYPNGASAAVSGGVDATTTIPFTQNISTFNASGIAAESYTGRVTWDIKLQPSMIDVLTFDQNISVTDGASFMLQFEVPLDARTGTNVTATVTKPDGTFLQVRPSSSLPTQPWFSISTRQFSDDNALMQSSIVDNLLSTSPTKVLSANQGYVLNQLIMDLYKKPTFHDAVSWGLIPGHTRVGAFGFNPDVDVGSVPEDAWYAGGLYPWPTGLVTLEVLSSSANDTSAGTGARTITLNCLDINYVPFTQTVTMNGTSVVAVPIQIFRINSASVASAGTGTTNAGDITIRRAGAGVTQALIPAGFSVTRQATYTVPAGFTLIVNQVLLSIEDSGGALSAAGADMVTWFRNPTTGVTRTPILLSTSTGQPYNHISDPPISVSEKSDFSLRFTRVMANNHAVTGAWNGILRDNTVVY